MSECSLCPLHLTAANVCIPGRGPRPASVLVVGSNPIGSDDTLGACFTGKHGRLLDELLTQSGFDPSNVRITNAVRCQTADKLKPMPESVNACRPYLRDEIHAVQPKIIIALGDTALQSLCKSSGVSVKRGSSYPLHAEFGYSCDVWPTYDTGHVLRLPNTRAVVLSDFRRARDSAMPEDDVKWEWWDPSKPLPWRFSAYDIETDYKGDNRVTQAAVSDGHSAFVCAEEFLEEFQRSLQGRTLVGHNSWAFDDPRTGLVSSFDTMAMAYLCDETQPLGLEPLCVRYLGVRGWKDAKDAELGSEQFAAYNARDAIYTFQLREVLAKELGDRSKLIPHLHKAFLALEECTRHGVWIDSEAVAKAREMFDAAATEARKKMPEIYAKGVHSKKTGELELKEVPFNPQSNRHIADWLTEQGFHLPSTATGTASTAAATIAALPQTGSVLALTEYRKAKKAINAFVKPYEEFAATDDGRVHPTYTLLRTSTGRTSARNPNIQQIPRDPVLRSMLSAPPGRVLVSADYGAIEFRVAAWCAQEASIIARYKENADWDPHRWFAALVYSKPESEITKEERQIAKSANFGLLYMAQAPTLQEYVLKTTGIHLTISQCGEIRRLWHETFPGFRGWYKRVNMFMREYGYVENAIGRRRHFANFNELCAKPQGELVRHVRQDEEGMTISESTVRSYAGDLTNAMWREAVNFQVQSFAADIALAAMHECHANDMPICAFIHDDIKFEYDADVWEETRQRKEFLIRDAMIDSALRNLQQNFGVIFDVPLTVEIKSNVADTAAAY